MGDARAAVKHQHRIGCGVDFPQPGDVQPGRLLVEAVGRPDGHGQRVDTGAGNESGGLVRGGKASALGLPQFSDVAQFGFDMGAVAAGHFDHSADDPHVLVEGLFAGVDHYRVETRVEARLDEFFRIAVVEVYPPLQPVVGQSPATHCHGLVQPHVSD